jgi:ABC-type nitrate/sulfonate/bicarbonate transport system permease component
LKPIHKTWEQSLMSSDTFLGYGNITGLVWRWSPRFLGIALTFVGWFALASVFPQNLMPYPDEVIYLTWQLYASGAVFEHLIPTLTRIGLAFAGAMVLGIILGTLMGTRNFAEMAVSPLIVIGLSVPGVSLAAMATLIFGFSILAPVSMGIIAVTPFITINVWKGVSDIDMDLVEMAQAFDVSPLRSIRRIIIPNAAPSLFAAARFGLALSWKAVTVAEAFASADGIGHKILQTYRAAMLEETWAWAGAFIVLIIIVEYGIFKPIEQRAFRYRVENQFTLFG